MVSLFALRSSFIVHRSSFIVHRSSFFFFYRNDCYDNSLLVIILVGTADEVELLHNNDEDMQDKNVPF